MSAPEPASPLSNAWRAGRHGAAGGDAVAISARQTALVQVTARRGACDAVRAALAAKLSLDPPGPGGSAASGDLVALAIAPETWLVMAARGCSVDLFRMLGSATGTAASLVDQSMGRVVFRLAGAKARDVLAKGCRLDLHPRVFWPGRVAVTPIAHVAVTLRQVDAVPTFDLIVPASTAETFLEWLLNASVEFGADLERL